MPYRFYGYKREMEFYSYDAREILYKNNNIEVAFFNGRHFLLHVSKNIFIPIGTGGEDDRDIINLVSNSDHLMDAIDNVEQRVHGALSREELFDAIDFEDLNGISDNRKRQIEIMGRSVWIENSSESKRTGIDANGRKWNFELVDHYGYFQYTLGMDGDEIDVYINSELTKEEIESMPVFKVHQLKMDSRELDEYKVILGATTEEEAKEIYLRNYRKGFNLVSTVTKVVDLDTWLKRETVKNKGKE